MGSKKVKPNFRDHFKYFLHAAGNKNINDFHVQEQVTMKHCHTIKVHFFSFKVSDNSLITAEEFKKL